MVENLSGAPLYDQEQGWYHRNRQHQCLLNEGESEARPPTGRTVVLRGLCFEDEGYVCMTATLT